MKQTILVTTIAVLSALGCGGADSQEPSGSVDEEVAVAQAEVDHHAATLVKLTSLSAVPKEANRHQQSMATFLGRLSEAALGVSHCDQDSMSPMQQSISAISEQVNAHTNALNKATTFDQVHSDSWSYAHTMDTSLHALQLRFVACMGMGM